MGAPRFKRAAYILRTCNAAMQSHGGFQWPDSGMVESPDWAPTEECGAGLHGFLNGEGDSGLCSWDDTAKWIVAEIEAGWIDLGGKVKFPRAKVVHVGDRHSASVFLASKGVKGAIVGGTATAGDRGTATAGVGGTATAGDRGILLIRFYDQSAGRYRIITGYIGEDGIEPNKAYKVEGGKIVEARK